MHEVTVDAAKTGRKERGREKREREREGKRENPKPFLQTFECTMVLFIKTTETQEESASVSPLRACHMSSVNMTSWSPEWKIARRLPNALSEDWSV